MYLLRMVKQKITLSVDSEVVAKAKENMWNLSEVTEAALREKMNQKEVIVEDALCCAYCSKEMPQAYVDHDTRELVDGLTWLYPYEEWICPSCLRNESIKLVKTAQ